MMMDANLAIVLTAAASIAGTVLVAFLSIRNSKELLERQIEREEASTHDKVKRRSYGAYFGSMRLWLQDLSLGERPNCRVDSIEEALSELELLAPDIVRIEIRRLSEAYAQVLYEFHEEGEKNEEQVNVCYEALEDCISACRKDLGIDSIPT